MQESLDIWIPGNVPSSKNLKRWNSKTNNSYDAPLVRKWKESTAEHFLNQRETFLKELEGLSLPYYIEFTFVRDSRRVFDYINPQQTIQDAMTFWGWLQDDNVVIIKPYFGDFKHDKNNPGVIIKVLREKPLLNKNEVRQLLIMARDAYKLNDPNAETILKQVYNLLL
jgi:Holliday junction resolvase RusA-like endonuclease